ncbi:ParB/RepB/Spo0J family partition protein [Microbacterium sp. NIBRBAC000506063]|uniref:ParB/RepB/Spo0J family partition protein n=1 Tax=Microbacterium sp. NIBRBAC000506063 TaxID=2734618 RepID=UPI001BB55EF6|nr:ParB N-terminal domain-containing protein [Microbacterium sp. NIBRBAC000506063]QTV79462.1 ParB N-terminal domain-containing protein [Microbacterium sp. NIBRBAC000506063]
MARKTTTPTLTAVTLLDIDPATLGVDDQVRSDATPDAELIASVRRFGILQPPTVYRDPVRNKHIVVIGHRRVGAAIAAKLPSIQVLVRDEFEAKDALRTEQQLVENMRREGLTPADQAAGYKALHMFGLRPEDIAAAVADKPERVKAALTAMESEVARAGLAGGVDLEQAALIAEFDDDPTAQADLSKVALSNPARFASDVEYYRRRRAAKIKRTQLEEQLRTESIEIVGEHGYDNVMWDGNGDTVPWGQGRRLHRLSIEPADHTTCPGHAAIITNANSADTMDIRYVCTDWKTHHPDAEGPVRELTPEEQAEAQERAKAREQQEQLRLAYEANATARRDWLRGFIKGRLNQTQGSSTSSPTPPSASPSKKTSNSATAPTSPSTSSPARPPRPAGPTPPSPTCSPPAKSHPSAPSSPTPSLSAKPSPKPPGTPKSHPGSRSPTSTASPPGATSTPNTTPRSSKQPPTRSPKTPLRTPRSTPANRAARTRRRTQREHRWRGHSPGARRRRRPPGLLEPVGAAMTRRRGPYKPRTRLHVDQTTHHEGDTVIVGAVRWIIRTITDQDVTLEASNASPGIIWRTTLNNLPDPVKEQR